MKDLQFPLFKSKIEGASQKFDLNDPEQRKEYFELKAGKEIQKLREYLKHNTFIAYFLGKKNAGKGTYSNLFREIVDSENVEHFSIGDTTRKVDRILRDEKQRKVFISFLEKNYRGYIPLEKAISLHENRNTATLLPTEWILTLIKKEVSEKGKKTLFIDGFFRDLDQISYSLFFRDLIGYRDDSDIFILIDIPETVIDARMKSRVICPKCGNPRSLKLLPTKEVRYDKEKKEFYLLCDNPGCEKVKMKTKEGDELGIEPIRHRLALDEELIKKAYSFYGIPKILLRNHIPVEKAKDYINEYEITPEYSYEWDGQTNQIKRNEKPFQVLDDEGVLSYSLLAATPALSMIKQMVKVLNL